MASDDTPRRRSGRAAKPNKKYVVDPFEEHQDLLGEEAASPVQFSNWEAKADADDDDFDASRVAEAEAEAAAEDDGEDETDDASDPEVEVVPPGFEDSDNDEPIIDVAPTARTKPKATPRPARPAAQLTTPLRKASTRKKIENMSYSSLPIFDPMGNTGAKGRNIQFTRGVPEAIHQQNREQRTLYTHGPGEEDLIAHVQGRERWLDDVTLPYRKQHNLTKGKVGGGLGYSAFYPEKKRKREAEDEMAWYHENGGKEAFGTGQFVKRISREYAPNNFTRSEDIVAGSADGFKLFDGLEAAGTCNLGTAYVGTKNEDDHQSWIINCGARIQCLEWCPNQPGQSQYLAVATTQQSSEKPNENEEEIAPAVAPKAHRQQCLQIWEACSNGEEGGQGARLDYAQHPKPRQIISTDWGYVKKMRWCQIPDRAGTNLRRLGLLAATFSDGKVRILDLSCPEEAQPETEYLHVEQAAFESRPLGTICTCLTWLSSKNIAVGTADGSVAIYTLPDCLTESAKSTSSETRNAHPWFYQRLHQGYIQSMTSGYPSRPHLLITYSFDGLLRITDLRHPSTDTALTQRSRIAQGPVVWHDLTQSALNIDDNFTMKSYGSRMFYKAVSVARLTAFGSDMSVSPLHASVLIGCVDGTVWVTNPMRRLRDHKSRPLVQCVLKHEWRRPIKAADQTNGNDVEKEQSEMNTVLSRPLIRITTGYKVVQSDMGQEGRANATKDFVSFATVHEEKTACTQVAWNPNLTAGTWAAFGMASGLVIIKDLAAD